MKRGTLLLLLFTIVNAQGCGLLYTNIVRPHSRDFNSTPVGSKQCILSGYKFQVPIIPIARSRVSAEWDTQRIIEQARQAGITQVYYTDVHIQEILLGTLRRQAIIIYGD